MAAGAIKRWAPAAKKKRQRDEITIAGSWTSGDTITVNVGGAEWTVSIGSLVTTAQVATTLKQAFEGESFTDTTASMMPPEIITNDAKTTHGQFANLTATVSGSLVYVKGASGIPFTMTVTESTAGTGTATNATPAGFRASGPEFFDDPDNWEDGAIPQDDDVWVFENGLYSCKYNIDTGLMPRDLIIPKSFDAQIGLPEINRDTPSLPYKEYRQRQLKLQNAALPASTRIKIGEGSGNGSSLIRIDTNDCDAVETWVYGTSSGIDNAPAVLLKGPTSGLSFELHIIGQGSVGVGYYRDETTRLTDVIETVAKNASDIELVLGEACLLFDVDARLYGGTVDIRNGDLSSITSGNYKLRIGNGTILKATLEP